MRSRDELAELTVVIKNGFRGLIPGGGDRGEESIKFIYANIAKWPEMRSKIGREAYGGMRSIAEFHS